MFKLEVSVLIGSTGRDSEVYISVVWQDLLIDLGGDKEIEGSEQFERIGDCLDGTEIAD